MERYYGEIWVHLNHPLDSQLIKHVLKVYELAYKKDLIDNYYASYQAYGFIMECQRYFKQFKQKENLPEYIIKASNYIKTHFAEPLSIEDIAASVNLSKYYFIKRFGETMNMTPGQFITKNRLEQAIHLLRNTELPIKEIAVKVGYGDDNYFNKAFRKVVGTSPGEFRKNKQLPFDRLIIQ
ncbi:MAG: AraC family transcriptional regulator [Bacillus sp. (in: Bacteria)]|nr:AraC family transcriptional regulator [Bacillus sp. (in: firmicutes)]